MAMAPGMSTNVATATLPRLSSHAGLGSLRMVL